MFRIFEFVFAVLVIGATLATCALTLPMETPNGVRQAASLLARKSTLPTTQACRVETHAKASQVTRICSSRRRDRQIAIALRDSE
jgi:hypothetical protein